MVQGLEVYRVYGLGFGVEGFGLRVIRVQGLEIRLQGAKVSGGGLTGLTV